MTYVQWLHRGKLGRAGAGGKGASLSELADEGFQVPVGFVVTAAAYRRFEEAAGLSRLLPSLFADVDFKNGESLRRALSDVGPLVTEEPLPEDVARETSAAYEELVSMAGLACAVRSSAVGEDSAKSAFAGLYESYLNVLGTPAVLESLKRCYASLWAERAVRYRALRTGSAANEAMAVVIMALVPCETAGIAFTVHPVTGQSDRVLINSSWGLGEAIVSGRVTPDSFTVAKDGLEIIEREVYMKELIIQPHPDGQGTIEIEPSAEKAKAPSLSEDAARAVARLASEIERYYGSPQDVEWGMAAGQIYVLQSRPITTLA
jgi:phosphoenolpyruvate synthase/pyruvate phosphate dikinase